MERRQHRKENCPVLHRLCFVYRFVPDAVTLPLVLISFAFRFKGVAVAASAVELLGGSTLAGTCSAPPTPLLLGVPLGMMTLCDLVAGSVGAVLDFGDTDTVIES